MVMRDGIACGLTMMSGVTPSTVNGMSSWRYVMPTVPFWPWRDENLSPICGTRIERVRTLTKRTPSPLVVSITRSMWPCSVERSVCDESRFVCGRARSLSPSGGNSVVSARALR